MASEEHTATSQQNQRTLNQEQYDILKRCSAKRNIAEWNSYRAKHPEITIQLQNADLRGGSLEGAKLSEANLEGARFEGADLLAADLRNADLRKANFEDANLWAATLSDADLEEARLVSANLENADLRRANLEKSDIRGANLEEAIAETNTEENRPGSDEDVEVIFDLADDITYREFVSLVTCLERLSLIVAGSPPHLNGIQISNQMEAHVAREETEMDNVVSINIPKNLAENLREIFLWGITAGQAGNEEAIAETVECRRDSDACGHLREFLTSAGFSEKQRETILANQTLPSVEQDRMMEDIRVVANLVGCRRIYFEA